MPNLLDRPYVGNFRPNARRVVKYTPDALIYLNGDIAIPGCPKCNGRIDIQRFVKSISVEAGTNAGAASGTAQLSVPVVFGEQIFREGKSLIQPAMEVHVYMRGYFPVQGQFAHLDTAAAVGLSGISKENFDRFATYPYYHVFHGVITQVSWDYSDGFYTASINFASMLHFWQYHNIIQNAATIAVKPEGGNYQQNVWGNIYTNMHPYAIIYDLYRSIIGAPGGVEHATGQVTNLDATITTRDGQNRSVFSMMQMYWEERFRTSIQNLRMYGVNGRLYNSVQQAYIGRRNSTKLSKLIQHNQHLDLDALSNVKDPFSQTAFSLAKSIGLASGGLDLTFAPTLGQEGNPSSPEEPLSFNMTEIYAFTLNPTSANLQDFESTYQTKLDIANEVCQATGFEFYQDVDGDLVFKPPFYNMNTRSSRVYRLEDIDIISASFSEKEPEATWCTVKSGVITGLAQMHEDYVGNRGTFVDWRLVAKYGWRPANLTVSYSSSPKMLFLIAQSRLDILNIDIHSASVSIPLRPELRPGYPVYIPFVDSYYYVTALSHQFVFGGQCSTSLTLTARRAKFFAPGLPGKLLPGENAIDRIKLDEPWLPERPLEIMDNGIPRWVGFPNVVLALDPLKLNPKMFAIRSGLEDLSTEIIGEGDVQMLFNIINEQVKNTGGGAGVFALATPSEDDPSSPTEHTRYVLRQSNDRWDDIEFSLDDLRRAYKPFDLARREIQARRGRVAALKEELRRAGRGGSREGIEVDVAGGSTNTDAIQARLNAATASLREATTALAAGLPDGEGNLNTLVLLIQALQNNDVVRRSFSGMPDAPTTMAWLEIMADTKVNMSPGTALPGYYRYYSASHPDPKMQGQATLAFTEGSDDDLFLYQDETLSEPAETQGGEVEEPAKPAPAPPEEIPDEIKVTDDGRVKRKQPGSQTGQFDDYKRGRAGRQEFEDVARRAQALGVPEAYIRYMRVQAARETGNSWNTGVVALQGRGSARRDFNRRKKRGAFKEQTAPDDHYTMGAVGLFQLLPATGMATFAGTECENLDPYAMFDPDYAMAANLANLRGRQRVMSGKVHQLPSSERTWQMIARSQQNIWSMNPNSMAPTHYVNNGGGLVTNSLRLVEMTKEGEEVDARLRKWAAVVGEDESFLFESGPPPRSSWGFPADNVNSRGRRGFNPCAFAAALKELRAQEEGEATQNQLEPPTPSPSEGLVARNDPSRIEITPAKLDTRRPVQGFPNGTLPLGSRPVEAALGDVIPERGIKVVVDNSSQMEVVDTSRIQRLTFTRTEINKSITVEGLANEQGIYDPTELEAFLIKNLTQRFQRESNPNITGLESTPNDFLKETYDQIRSDLLVGVGVDPRKDPEAKSYPLYGQLTVQEAAPQDQFFIAEFVVVRLPTFEEAAETNEILATVNPFDPTIDFEVVFDKGERSAAGLTLQELGKVPPFQGKSLDLIVEKVIAAYVSTVVKTVVEAFISARDSAGFIEGKRPFGFTDRMAFITDSFNSIALAVTLVEFDIRNQRSEARALRAAKKNHGIYTPVFPVSDGAGYEHIGAFRYGRGLSADPGGNFALLNTSDDPWLNVSARTAEAFLDALVSIQQIRPPAEGETAKNAQEAFLAEEIHRLSWEQARVVGQLQGGARDIDQSVRNALTTDGIRRIAQVRLALQEMQKTNPDAVRELEEANGLDQGVLTIRNPRPNLFETRFANFPANQLQEGVLKTTVTNAAYNLVDLEPHLQQKTHMTCACEGNASRLLLPAFGRDGREFLAIEGIDGEKDPATASLSEEILRAIPDYVAQRQALRGQQLDTKPPSLSDAFDKIKDIRNAIPTAREQLQEAGEQLTETARQLGEIDLGGD